MLEDTAGVMDHPSIMVVHWKMVSDMLLLSYVDFWCTQLMSQVVLLRDLPVHMLDTDQR